MTNEEIYQKLLSSYGEEKMGQFASMMAKWCTYCYLDHPTFDNAYDLEYWTLKDINHIIKREYDTGQRKDDLRDIPLDC